MILVTGSFVVTNGPVESGRISRKSSECVKPHLQDSSHCVPIARNSHLNTHHHLPFQVPRWVAVCRLRGVS